MADAERMAGLICPLPQGNGNAISGGMFSATRRLLLGYDPVLALTATVGARVGLAFGKGPESKDGSTDRAIAPPSAQRPADQDAGRGVEIVHQEPVRLGA